MKPVSRKHIYFFVGTNAEFIKLAPIIKGLRKRKVNFKLITSGQSQILFGELKDYTGPLKADISFNVPTSKLSVPHFFIWSIKTFLVCLTSLRKEFKDLVKDKSYFIVHGDTVSSLLGAVIARIYRLKLVHVESGLRSFNFFEPFPEEINRFIISHLAHIRFPQNKWALKNLEKIEYGVNVNTKQNTLIETFEWAIKKKPDVNYIKKSKKYYVLYIRRQEHIIFKKKWISEILQFVVTNVDQNLNCIFVLHPLTSNFLSPEKLNEIYKLLGKRLFLVSRIPYVDFMKVMKQAEFAVTDGCTNQEELYYMGLPFLVLRNRTERTEGLGENVVISKGNKKIMKNFFKNYKRYRRKMVYIKEKPSKIIVDYLSNF